jgi:hypothetical protein
MIACRKGACGERKTRKTRPLFIPLEFSAIRFRSNGCLAFRPRSNGRKSFPEIFFGDLQIVRRLGAEPISFRKSEKAAMAEVRFGGNGDFKSLATTLWN